MAVFFLDKNSFVVFVLLLPLMTTIFSFIQNAPICSNTVERLVKLCVAVVVTANLFLEATDKKKIVLCMNLKFPTLTNRKKSVEHQKPIQIVVFKLIEITTFFLFSPT